MFDNINEKTKTIILDWNVMSDAEEEVKTHPCDKYKIPDCPGMIPTLRVETSAGYLSDSTGNHKISSISFFGIILSWGNESPWAALVQNKIIWDFSSQGQILWRLWSTIGIRWISTWCTSRSSPWGNHTRLFEVIMKFLGSQKWWWIEWCDERYECWRIKW